MTLRAVVLGSLIALAVAVGGHFNDVYIAQTYLVGNFLPISVIGLLVVLALAANPMLARLRSSWPFTPRELAVIAILPLAVCAVPGSGFLRTFTTAMVLPYHYERLTPAWQSEKVIGQAPAGLLARVTPENEEEVLGVFLKGKGSPGKHIGMRGIPWRAWWPAIGTWIPLFLVLMAALIGLSLVLHRQWTTHEHLVYPVAEFVRQLTGADGDAGAPAAPRRGLFWCGLVPVLIIHLCNGTNAWFPSFLRIPHHVDIASAIELFPRATATWNGWSLFYSEIFFTVVAFAFFLPSDVTLSLGLAGLVRTLFSLGLMAYGVTASFVWVGDGECQGLMFGAYAGMFLLILYHGRDYFWRVARAAAGMPRPGSRPESEAVWGARVFCLGAAGGAAIMAQMGLAWPYALALVALFVLSFTVMSRVCAETGLFFLQPSWMGVGVLLGCLGGAALGPDALLVAALLCVVLAVDPREAMMPFVVNNLRIAENAGLPRGRLALMGGLLLALGLAAGLACVLWLQYDRGVGMVDEWATAHVPKMGFDLLAEQLQKMRADGVLEQVRAASWAERLKFIDPNPRFLGFAATGFGLFALCAFLRLRLPRWPLHPVLFLVWFCYPIVMFGTSFLLGWLVKALVVKFGGGSAYQRAKPLMVGLVAGDLAGGLVFMIAGAVYYALTGFRPTRVLIFPP